MAGIEIGTLRLRGPPHLASRSAFRIEDACRTELADSQRLVLIRRMRPGPRCVSERPEERSDAIRRAYAAATSGARHGRDVGDGASVNCVWFESPAEARRLLLAELLAGRRPSGWFWRMAVPEWRGRDLEPWLVEIVARAIGGGGEPESLPLLLLALERADLDLVVRAVQAAARASQRSPAPPARPVHPGEATGAEVLLPSSYAGGATDLRESAAALVARLPAPLRDPIEILARRLGPGVRPVLRLLERLLLRASPSLALAPEPLRRLALAWSELIERPESVATPPTEETSAAPAASRREAEPASAPSPILATLLDPTAEARARAGKPPSTEETPAPVPKRPPPFESLLSRADSLPSDFAGLWLVVPSLIRLGFREWLCGQPHLLTQDCGRTLLRTLARHHRVPEGDPTLAAFAALDGIGDTPDWARCWRSGLDGWLRRRVRISLHRLVRKSGSVSLAEDRLVVRFPLHTADINLRRRALDVDPGWVDWLGLSVRYRYEETGR